MDGILYYIKHENKQKRLIQIPHREQQESFMQKAERNSNSNSSQIKDYKMEWGIDYEENKRQSETINENEFIHFYCTTERENNYNFWDVGMLQYRVFNACKL